MHIRQQVINEKIRSIANTLQIKESDAFVYFVQSIVTGNSIHTLDPNDITDGNQEKQIDTFTIEEQSDGATIYILQAKNSDSFSSNALILLANGLEWTFNRPRSDVESLQNENLKTRILEYRELLSSQGPSNIEMVVVYAANGDASKRSDEFKQEEKKLREKFDNGTFAKFQLLVLGVNELTEKYNAMEKKSRKINADLQIKFDTNTPSLIKYHSEGLKAVVCTTTGKEIARVVNDNSDALFDANIRRFLGTRGAVNQDILLTCSDKSVSNSFWFLNNGVTIICDKVDEITLPESPLVKIENMQIVNGCQTAKTLALAEQQGKLAADVRVMLKIYQTQNSELAGKLVLTTNNQNKITSRNLRSNDSRQTDLQRAFAAYGILYEIKPGEFDKSGEVGRKIVANELVAQSYLGTILKKPSDARRRKYKIWGELYDQVFGGKKTEQYIFAVELHLAVMRWLKLQKKDQGLRHKLEKNGAFHIARIAAHRLMGMEVSSAETTLISSKIDSISKNQGAFDLEISKALNELTSLVKKEKNPDLDSLLKSGAFDIKIDSYLNRPKKAGSDK